MAAGSFNLDDLIRAQRQHFDSGATRELTFRETQLKMLKDAIKASERALFDALKSDLGKPGFESYLSEIGFIYADIDHTLKHLRKWAKRRRVRTPVTLFHAKSYVYPEPLGRVLIIGPWNYPFMLLLSPLVGAIAAGNCVVLKPSEMAPATSKYVAKLIGDLYDPKYIAVVEGGVPETTGLLERQFDHIFFTGSTAVGKVIMTAAAKHLTPVTLELGGKSPCIVDETADLAVSAKRIVWGKFFNAGQSCVAPDYILAHRSIKPALVEKLGQAIEELYTKDPSKSPDYGRIVNERHFERLKRLIPAQATIGGSADASSRYIAPTILDGAKVSDVVMQEEIFGPILPVFEYSELSEALRFVRERDKPLAFYFFSSDRGRQEMVLKEVSFGGGCINDTMVHLASSYLPFGGVGPSGMGAYHGQLSFDAFSHRKAVVKKSVFPDLPLRYPPYSGFALKVMRWLLG